MILRRALLLACGIAALAAAAAMTVMALGFALYAALVPLWGPAMAAAGVAGACVFFGLLGGVFAILGAAPRPSTRAEAPEALSSRAFGMARENPVLAAAALGVIGVILVRNPKITTALFEAFLSRKPPAKG